MGRRLLRLNMFKLNMFKPTLNRSWRQVKCYFEHVQITGLSVTRRRGDSRRDAEGSAFSAPLRERAVLYLNLRRMIESDTTGVPLTRAGSARHSLIVARPTSRSVSGPPRYAGRRSNP